jgi:clan AA aspartic protease (TIGR02281 family)
MQKNNFYILFVMAVVMFLNGVCHAGVIYKCKNQEGVLVYQNSACREDAETVTSWEHKEKSKPEPVADENQDEEAKKRASTVLTLSQNASGHFTTDGSVDGKSLNFVVDTGASLVALPEELAKSADINCDNKIDMTTANGNTDGCTAKVKELKFGPYLIKDVAVVVMSSLPQPLLGMNVLQLFKVAQDKGEMKISVMDSGKPEGEKDQDQNSNP